jgi:hypothetical protein
MQRRLLTAIWVTMVVAVLAAAALIVGTSKTFQSCVQEANEQAITGLPVVLGIYRDCAGEFLHENGEAVTAFFTIILAVSTIGLWGATYHLYKAGEEQRLSSERIAAEQRQSSERIAERQSEQTQRSLDIAFTAANAAELSAKAAVGSELPLVFLTSIDVKPAIGSTPKIVSPSLPQIPSVVFVEFKNYGRTPAILHHLFIDWDVTSRLPDEPDYNRQYPLEDHVIEPRDSFDFFTTGDVIFDSTQIEAANRGPERLWVYGYLSYSDFLRNEHRIGFCAVWGETGDGPFHLMQAGTDKYIYQS